MKQRVRIRRIKDRTYPWYVYIHHIRLLRGILADANRKMSDAMREAYERSRE